MSFIYFEATLELPLEVDRRKKVHHINRVIYDLWGGDLEKWFERIGKGPFAHAFVANYLDVSDRKIIVRCLPDKVNLVSRRLNMEGFDCLFKEKKVTLDKSNIQDITFDLSYKVSKKVSFKLNNEKVLTNGIGVPVLPVKSDIMYLDKRILSEGYSPNIEQENTHPVIVKQFSVILSKITEINIEDLKEAIITGVGGRRSYGCGLVSIEEISQ